MARDALNRWPQDQHHPYPMPADPRRHRDPYRDPRREDPRRHCDNAPGSMPPRRLPAVRGGAGGSNVEQWRSRVDSRGYGCRPEDDWYSNSPSADYHPQRLMRAVDGGVDGFQPVRGWRNRYEDDYPPERTEQWFNDGRRRIDVGSPSSRHRLDATFRNDSLSSDPSDCVAVPSGQSVGMTRLTPKHHRRHKGQQHGVSSSAGETIGHVPGARRQSSVSSSDEGAQTTPEATSCDEEQEIESESIVSELGKCVSSGPSAVSIHF
jgi:hypothetical protein